MRQDRKTIIGEWNITWIQFYTHYLHNAYSLSTVSGALRLKHLRYTTIWWRVIADEMSEVKVRIDFTLVKLEREALINFTLTKQALKWRILWETMRHREHWSWDKKIKWRKWNSLYALTTSVKSTYEDSEDQLWTKNFCNCYLVISHCDKMMRSLSCVGSSHSVKYPVNGRTRYVVQPKYRDLKRTKAVGTNKAQGTIKKYRPWTYLVDMTKMSS